MIYKYGSSDAAHHNTGALQLLFWNAIRESLDGGLERFDFGRSDLDNEGLAVFKDRWGATRSLLSYWSNPPSSRGSRASLIRPLAQEVFSRIPDRLLTLSGRLLYKHFA
jgi:CelD/BcsL family acetyltransferase involved in cellulose biosynthesis